MRPVATISAGDGSLDLSESERVVLKCVQSAPGGYAFQYVSALDSVAGSMCNDMRERGYIFDGPAYAAYVVLCLSPTTILLSSLVIEATQRSQSGMSNAFLWLLVATLVAFGITVPRWTSKFDIELKMRYSHIPDDLSGRFEHMVALRGDSISFEQYGELGESMRRFTSFSSTRT